MGELTGGLIVVLVLAVLVIIIVAKTAVVVPQQSAYIVERLGKYSGTLDAGFHILVPFMDVIRYRHTLKEMAIDIPEQICITRDNVQVGVDGVLYLKVLNPERASYGIGDFNRQRRCFERCRLWLATARGRCLRRYACGENKRRKNQNHS